MAATLMNANLGRTSTTVAHTISGRSNPLVVIGKTGLRTGTLTWRFLSLEEAEAFIASRTDSVQALSAPAFPDLSGMHYIVENWSTNTWERLSGGWAWDVTADVIEVL